MNEKNAQAIDIYIYIYIYIWDQGYRIYEFCDQFLRPMSAHIGLFSVLPKVAFRYGCFLVSSLIFLKHHFIEHFSAIGSISSNEKDSIATMCHACKTGNWMYTKFKESIYKKCIKISASYLWDICAVQYMLHDMWSRSLKNTFEVIRSY